MSRYSKEAKARINIDRPDAIRVYNTSMGGTDRQDQNVNNYRISLRGKKWWFPVFTWLLDVSAQNAWLIGKCSGAKNCDTFLNFRRHVVNYYLGHYGAQPKTSGRRSLAAPGQEDLRFDGIDHLVRRNANDARRRCANCGSRSVYGCVKCDTGLCPECFISYHTMH